MKRRATGARVIDSPLKAPQNGTMSAPDSITAPQSGRIGYLADLDGLRALSVLLVMLFHAFPDSVPGGFVGVDVFFVISGFIITRLIDREMGQDRFSYSGFLLRRVRRLWANFLAVAAFSLAMGWLTLSGAEYRQLAEAAMAAGAFASNWYFFATTDYFNEAMAGNYLLHAWSLSVEEQFYLIYPLILLAGWRLKLAPLWIVGGIGLASLAASILSAFAGGDQGAFFATHLRVWELASGAALHFALKARLLVVHGLWAQRGMLYGGVLLILISAFALTGAGRFPGYQAVLPVAGALLTVAFAASRPQGAPVFVTGRRGVVYAGWLSYSLYLWHWPVLQITHRLNSDPEDWHMLLALAVSAVMAAVAYHVLETPIRRGRWLAGRAALLTFFGLSLGALMAASWAIRASDGAPGRIPPAAQAALSVAADQRGTGVCGAAGVIAQERLGLTLPDNPARERTDLCLFGDLGAAPDLVIWGDSHLGAIAGAVGRRLAEGGRSAVIIARGACPPLLDAAWSALPPEEAALCRAWGEQALDVMAAVVPDAIALVGHWDLYAPQPGGLIGGPRPGKLRAVGPALKDEAPLDLFSAAMETTLARLPEAGVIRVLLDVPTHEFQVPEAVAFSIQYPYLPEPGWITAGEQSERRALYVPAIETAVSARSGRVLDPMLAFCPDDGACLGAIEDHPLFFDSSHLSARGAEYLLDAIPALIEDAP